jgi:DNA-binding response OmpR family regulator
MEASASLQEDYDEAALLGATARKPRILLVEDDTDMRRLVAAVLRRDGYEVVSVGTGIGMLRRVGFADRDGGYDLIVSDIQLPDLTALEVLEGLRCRDIGIPVVLMTAYGSDDARADACTLGAFAVLDKPFDWETLRAVVRKAVALG